MGTVVEQLKKISKSLLIGSLAGLGMALFTRFFFQDVIDRLEYVTYYMRYRWEYSELSNEALARLRNNEYGIHIIDIDDRSMQKLGLYWNWDRSYHARLIKNLSHQFPAAIVFDVLFGNLEDSNHQKRLEELLVRSKQVDSSITIPNRLRNAIVSTIDYDKQFIEATRDAGCVYHGLCLSDETDYKDFALSQVAHKMTMEWHDSLDPQSALLLPPKKRASIRHTKSIIDGIFPSLAKASKGIGHVDIVPNEDGIIREVPLLYGFGDFPPVYLPISIQTMISLFGTPMDEVIFKPGKYIDIGKPFKLFRQNDGTYRCSYPNVSADQIKAILDRSSDIMLLQPNTHIEISSFLAVARDSAGAPTFSMKLPGDLPPPIVEALCATEMDSIMHLEPGETRTIGPDIQFVRNSDVDWILTAPFDMEEWWFTRTDLLTIAQVSKNDLKAVPPGQRKLLFHSFIVKNNGGTLISSLPCMRGETIKDLCGIPWKRIESMQPGSRLEFGRRVRIPLTPDNTHILTFFGPKKTPFPAYSYYDILKNRVQGSLEGKIYIIGSSAPALFDIKAVPHDRSFPAVEIHASIINSILTNTFITRLATWQDFIILVVVGIIIGFISYSFKPLVGAIIAGLSIFIYFVIAMTIFSVDHVWIEIARPILTILITFTAVMAYRYITEEKDRMFLQNTFKTYLSPELIDIMYKQKQQPKLGGEEGVRTAYFTDIQGFSTFSEKLGSPTRLVELLNEYLTAMTDILLAHYGTLDKYEGDAIIAFFGAPMPIDNHAYQACTTALAMQRRLGELRKKWQREDKWPEIVHQMRMRIGINTGQITTGNMGSAVRMNYTMMGDAVNLAARLESAAKQYGVYTVISQFTYDMVRNDFIVRQLDKITVVGKSEPVVVYELLAEKGDMDTRISLLLNRYQEALGYFYKREWDRAIAKFREAEELEPQKVIAPMGMNPSHRIIEYCKQYKKNPPGPQWDGVTKLSTK